jgi:hypothetical protein
MDNECSSGAAAVCWFPPRRHSVFRVLHCLTTAISLVAAARAACPDSSPRVWLISTRSAPHDCRGEADPQCLSYCRLDDGCQWSPSDAEAFNSGDDRATPTVVFIHGNRTDSAQAIKKGWYVYEILQSASAGRPFRYVIWSWPAERVCRGTSQDTRIKADYSDVESGYLARWLNRLKPGVKVTLIGHSFGPRIITGAFQLLAGGDVSGQVLPQETVAAWKDGKRNPVRAVLLASAMDFDWLAPGGCHGLALSLIEQSLITRNGCDRVLRYYPRLYGRDGPQALGFVGPAGVDGMETVELIDVSGTVGKIHDWRHYCSASNVCERWARYMFLEDL